MQKCREIVHFEKAVWDDFVRAYINRIENKQ